MLAIGGGDMLISRLAPLYCDIASHWTLLLGSELTVCVPAMCIGPSYYSCCVYVSCMTIFTIYNVFRAFVL